MDPRDRFSLGSARGGPDPALRRPKLSHAEQARQRHLMQEQMRTRPPTFDIKRCTPVVSCEMWQAKTALHDLGVLDRVDAAMKSEEKAVQIEWEYSTKATSVGKVADAVMRALGWDQAKVEQWIITADKKK